MATYYCTSPRHSLTGNPKLRCLPDGSWDAAPPACRIKEDKIRMRNDELPVRKVLPPAVTTRRPDFTRARTPRPDRPYIKTQRDPTAGKKQIKCSRILRSVLKF